MANALLVAQILGPVYLAVGVGFFVSSKHYEKMIAGMMKDKTMMYLGGIMALVVGILILRVHSGWMKDWTALVTLVGWLAAIKGVCLLVIPEQFMGWFDGMVKSGSMMTLGKVVALVIGAVFTYYGYMA